MVQFQKQIPKEMGVKLEVKLEDVETMTHEMVLEIINCLAKKIAGKQKKLFYEEIGRFADEVGNVISGDGNSLLIDMLYQMLEKIPRGFDEGGNPTEFYVLVAHPKSLSFDKKQLFHKPSLTPVIKH